MPDALRSPDSALSRDGPLLASLPPVDRGRVADAVLDLVEHVAAKARVAVPLTVVQVQPRASVSSGYCSARAGGVRVGLSVGALDRPENVAALVVHEIAHAAARLPQEGDRPKLPGSLRHGVVFRASLVVLAERALSLPPRALAAGAPLPFAYDVDEWVAYLLARRVASGKRVPAAVAGLLRAMPAPVAGLPEVPAFRVCLAPWEPLRPGKHHRLTPADAATALAWFRSDANVARRRAASAHVRQLEAVAALLPFCGPAS